MESAARFQEGRWVEEARRWGRNEGIPGFVLENEFPYLAATYDTDRLAEAALATGHGVRYALCVPIKDSDHRVLGFFELFRGAAAAPFTWQDAAFLESLASTTAVALENATLLRELAAKHEEVKLLSAGHLEMLEAERRHIARELHDESGQALVGIKLALQVMARHVGDGNPALREQLDHVRSEVNAATTRLKQIARRLRPPALDSLGLHPAIAQLAQDVGERGGLSTAVDLAWLPERLSSELETALFRIAQEAFTNVVRHAEARQASLTMGACEGFVRMRIHDDGRGFDPTATTGGLGLLGIRERVDNLGGFFRVESAPGAGTSLLVELPL
jgi:two-component system NarL family sensor kinase